MVENLTDGWQRLYLQKKHGLEEEGCTEALEIRNFGDLEEKLRYLTAVYSRTSFPGLLERLMPGLRHLKSFTSAISSATQYDPVACLIWGGVQAVLKCACEHDDVLNETSDVLIELNSNFPVFERYLKMFPEHKSLQLPLQDLFEDYLEFCLETINYLKRRPSAVNFLSFIWTSKPSTLVAKTRTNIKRHFEIFDKYAELAHRQSMHNMRLEVEELMKNEPLAELGKDDQESRSQDSVFPIYVVDSFRNFTFMGRDDLIKRMREVLDSQAAEDQSDRSLTDHEGKSSMQETVCCVLHGLGGIGKTQTALEYYFRFRDEYEAVFWVQAQLGSTIAASFCDIAERLHLTTKNDANDAQKQGRSIKKAIEWFKTTTRKWLIVFDNVEDIHDLHEYLPSHSTIKGSVIITTQHSNFAKATSVFEQIHVKNFDSRVGSEFLFSLLQRQPKDDAEDQVGRRVSEIVGGLPLALATIGGYLSESDYEPSQYLSDMQTSSNAWTAASVGTVENYEKTLESVFQIAFRELSKPARDLLNLLAFLDPDNIPEDLFMTQNPSQAKPVYTRAQLIDLVRELRRRQLVKRDTSGREPVLVIHRSVQWNVLLDLSKDYDDRWRVFEEIFSTVCASLPQTSSIDNPEPELWPRFKKYVPQLLSLRSHCLWPEPPVELPEDFAKVLSHMATFMWHAGLASQGYKALRTAEDILDATGATEENPLKGDVQGHLGIIASFQGVSQRKECMNRRHAALNARRKYHSTIPQNKVTREDEIRLYNVESDMAFGLMQEENFEESEQYIEKCHEQYKIWGSDKEVPFEYLKYHHIISYIRMSQNRPVEAINHCKKAAKLGEVCAGVSHPITQLCRFSLANHLYLAGQLKPAISLSLSVLEARSQVCGDFNPFTLESHALCGFLLMEDKKFDQAALHLEACLDRRKRSAWNAEGVARAQYIYSLTLENLGRHGDAKKLRREALRTRDAYLRLFPQYLRPSADSLKVFDQMVCLWGGRFTGRLAQEQLSAPHTVDSSDTSA